MVMLFAITTAPVHAEPIVPTHDDEVIELLPTVAGDRGEARRLRRQLVQRPADAGLALDVARRYLEQAHTLGDPRFAGLAMAALQPWSDARTMPADVLLMKATLQQYLHDFDASVASLQALLARPGAPAQPQAWLTLATVRRVQGRYGESDEGCRQVGVAGSALHAQACLAENAALRGDVASARAALNRLRREAGVSAATRAWLTTTLAELEQRAAEPAAAEAAFRAALALQPDDYTTLAYADFLLERRRPAEALALLKARTRSDAVVLRLAIAGAQAKSASAATDAAEMRERIALANQRPDAKRFHGREQAMFALLVDRQARLALDLARGNVAQQREPLDLLVLAQAARASGDAAAIAEVRALLAATGLKDRRIEALL